MLLYKDDILVVGHDPMKIKSLKKELSKVFVIKDLGPVKQIIGMRITRDRKNGKVCISREIYWKCGAEKIQHEHM